MLESVGSIIILSAPPTNHLLDIALQGFSEIICLVELRTSHYPVLIALTAVTTHSSPFMALFSGALPKAHAVLSYVELPTVLATVCSGRVSKALSISPKKTTLRKMKK